MIKIVYLPHEANSLNLGFTDVLYEKSKEITIVHPKGEILPLGDFPGDFGKIEKYLISETKDADYLVISVDALLYGGVVNSRRHYLPKKELKKRLDLLSFIKNENPNVKIYAYLTVMRSLPFSQKQGEQDYYGICGEELFLFGQNEHLRRKRKISGKLYRQSRRVLLPVCGPYLKDYINRRKLNLLFLGKTINLSGKIIDELFIVNDLFAPYGFLGADTEKVNKYCAKHRDKVSMIPSEEGAGLCLVSRIILKERGESFGVCPIYPDSFDRKMDISVKKIIECVGAAVTDEKNADLLLFCNVKPSNEEATLDLVGTRNYADFIYKMKKALEDKKKIALTDDYSGEGGDLLLLSGISEKVGVFKLAGYSGRKDVSGAVAESLAESVLFFSDGNVKSHRKRIATRIYEDVGISKADKNVSESCAKSGKEVTVKAIIKSAQEIIEKEVPEVFDRFKIEQAKLLNVSPFRPYFVVSEKVDK